MEGVWGRRRHDGAALRHLLLAGGSVAEWHAFSDDQWRSRLEDLFEVARRAGAKFVTVHPHEPAGRAGAVDSGASARHDDSSNGNTIAQVPHRLRRRELTRDGIRVVVDPVVDGRDRIRDVVASWPSNRTVTEKRLGRALFGEAGEPDLVVILGPADRLPMSLVWELAYGELVFVDAGWSELGAEHVHKTVEEYARRQRRFGGVE